MTTPAGQGSEGNSQPMDLEQIQDYVICESESRSQNGQGNHDKSILEEENVDSLLSSSSRKSKEPLAEQHAASKLLFRNLELPHQVSEEAEARTTLARKMTTSLFSMVRTRNFNNRL